LAGQGGRLPENGSLQWGAQTCPRLVYKCQSSPGYFHISGSLKQHLSGYLKTSNQLKIRNLYAGRQVSAYPITSSIIRKGTHETAR
jgi:hypothetical protein